MTTKQKIKNLLGLNKVYLPYKVFLHRKQELNRIIKAGIIPVFNNHKTNGSLKSYSQVIKKPYSYLMEVLK